MVIDEVGAGTCVDDIRAAIAIDGLGSRTACKRIGARRPQDGNGPGHRTGVDIGEPFDDSRSRARLIGDIGKVQIDGGVKHEGVGRP